MDKATRRFHYSMALGESGRMGKLEVNKLQEELKKAKMDADYWRDKYDILLKNIESQQSYINYIESQVFGGKTY